MERALYSVSSLTCDFFSVVSCDQEGGARRCSGQGDVLAGTVGTFAAWLNSNSADYESMSVEVHFGNTPKFY
jgi:NAD(P)H-hydrate repair Nnr-like enzyme with NAD(P)H-hydrate dehydratase domain